MSKPHKWSFYRSGGVDQIIFRDGDDIANLEQLDQKLWMALSMPIRGTEFDPRTADLLDTDKDGRIRPPEVLAAVKWAVNAFKDVGIVMQGGDSVKLDSIGDPAILAGARRLLSNLGKPKTDAITMADVTDQAAVYAQTVFNGDGIIPADAAGDNANVKQAIEAIIASHDPVTDRSGKPGINQANIDAFWEKLKAWNAWDAQLSTAAAEVIPLGLDGTKAANATLKSLKAKIDDFFARCSLAAFDERAQSALNREESAYLSLAAKDLTISNEEIAALPLAHIDPDGKLPLSGSALNPAWRGAVETLLAQAVKPLLGTDRENLTQPEWQKLQNTFKPFEVWSSSKPTGIDAIEKIDPAVIRNWLADDTKAAIEELIKKDLALEPETAQLEAVEKLVRFQRDFFEFLTNYVTFADFYGRTDAVFQAGTLYLDARACHLCIEVADAAKHGQLAGLSACYLAYCDLTRPGGQKRSIVAIFTNGDSDNLMVGRNGIFYDRKGKDWDATIVKVVSNPISVREAFWLPYKKLIRMIEEQIAKRAQAADEASSAKLSNVATSIATADKAQAAAQPAAGATPGVPKKLDLGTIALIGTAVGGISALIGGLLQALFGLGFWLPLGLLGIILLISGPSMLMAAMKLRRRNLGPILDANGWAINTKARLNVPFGASLTQVAAIPLGSARVLQDPYAEKRRPWIKYVLVLIILGVLGYCWWSGRFDKWLPKCMVRHQPVETGQAAEAPLAEKIETQIKEAAIETSEAAVKAIEGK